MPENPRLSSLGMNGTPERSQLLLAEWRKIRHNLAMARYATGAHTKHRLQYHLVWIPKYRKRVLQGKIAIRLKDLLYEACKVNGWWISEMSIQDDHIHRNYSHPSYLLKFCKIEVRHILFKKIAFAGYNGLGNLPLGQ